MTKFTDLEFEPENFSDGIQAVVKFDNNYGASIIKSQYSYGGQEGLYELAVLHNGDLCYDTDITIDVLGHLKPEDITTILERIEKLPAKESVK